MKPIVVDASVMLKWQLRDEENTEQADRLLRDLIEGQIQIIVPSLWLYEVVNGIRAAVYRGRLSQTQGQRAIVDFLLIGVNAYPFAPMAARAYEIACSHNLAIYDSAYIALAERWSTDLYTADAALYDKVGKVLPFVKWFAKYGDNF